MKSAPPIFPASRAPISPAWSPASSAPSSPPSSPAAVTVDKGEVTGRAAAAILIAIGIALVNMAHVVGLTLMESVRYRGGFAKLFRYLSLIGTPLAVVVNFVLLVS